MTQGYLEFRPGGPFFDMIGSFLIAIAGSPAIINKDNPMKLDYSHYVSLPGILTPGRHIRPREVHEQVVKGHISQGRFLRVCCQMLANTAYEAVKEKNDHSPEFEFFRHMRNASSHQNRFNFGPKEPSRAAAWRGTAIEDMRKGTSNPLHGTECFGTFIGAPDLIDLLADIERKIAI